MAIKRLMAKALPDYLVNQVTAEVRLATRRMFTARSVRRSLASQNDWAIEYDVGFSGDWFFFFDSFREANYDFLACHLRDYIDEPDWPRWSLDNPRKSIALREQLRCFNPIFRLSNAALSFLHQSLLHGWSRSQRGPISDSAES